MCNNHYLKRLVEYIFSDKKLPADLPDDLVTPKAPTEYITEIQQTLCTVCPGSVPLEKSARITRKARIITMNGVIENVSTYFRRCPQCHRIYRYQEWQDSLHDVDDRVILSLELCVYLRASSQNNVSVSKVLHSLEVVRKSSPEAELSMVSEDRLVDELKKQKVSTTDMPALRKWWGVVLMENFDLGSHGKMFAHWTETSKALLRGEVPPVFRVRKRKLDDITEKEEQLQPHPADVSVGKDPTSKIVQDCKKAAEWVVAHKHVCARMHLPDAVSMGEARLREAVKLWEEKPDDVTRMRWRQSWSHSSLGWNRWRTCGPS
ncbi:hypothetical protein KUCAC02_010206 [Chaenocephalus aceratus]|uniref:Uncharacterized protein n=1 Tax=Chaenocephalus aceratus TaxID=36190 RepID=A0ACB9VYS8_CHAAC|nr:hypothetical protein KUCAC02_010206 [Chaenocephalus aceratus]